MHHNRTFPSRARRLSRAQLLDSPLSSIKRVYTVKNIKYGSYCDTHEYNKVQATFKPTRTNFEKTKEGQKDARNLWRAREKIYHIVESNIGGNGIKPIFFTLTQADQEDNLKIANRKIKALMRRIKKEIGRSPEYIIVPEMHKSGAIHYHGVFFNLPYINVKRFRYNLWKEGYVDLQLPKKIKSVARYLAKYFTKETQLKLPKHSRTYMCSKELKRPTTDYTDRPPSDIIEPVHVHIKKNGIKITYLCKKQP